MNLLLSRYVLCSSFLGHSYYQQLHKNLNRDPEIFSKQRKEIRLPVLHLLMFHIGKDFITSSILQGSLSFRKKSLTFEILL